MNTPPVENTPAPETPDYAAVLEEQKAVIAALNEKIKTLENKAASNEAKITALSKAPASAAPELKTVETAKTELDKAYEKVLKDLGIVKE